MPCETSVKIRSSVKILADLWEAKTLTHWLLKIFFHIAKLRLPGFLRSLDIRKTILGTIKDVSETISVPIWISEDNTEIFLLHFHCVVSVSPSKFLMGG